MKKGRFLCFLLALVLVSSLLSTPGLTMSPPPSFSTADIENFVAALQDEEVRSHISDWDNLIITDENYEGFVNWESPFTEKYPFLTTRNWGHFMEAYHQLHEIGYLPIPDVDDIQELTITENYTSRPFEIRYTVTTPWGEAGVSFKKGIKANPAFSAQEQYEAWRGKADHILVEYITTKHGEQGVWTIRREVENTFLKSCASCEPTTPDGHPTMRVAYDDFLVEVWSLEDMGRDEALCFIDSLEIEKRML